MNRSIGKTLKNKRVEIGLSLEEVAHNTRIRKEYLDAIEKDKFSSFDSHVYAKGFVRNYAKFLNLDEEALLSVYRRDFENTEIKRKIKKVGDEEIEEKKEKKLNIKDIKLNSKQIKILAFLSLVAIIVIILLNLLNQAFKPPMLKLTSPVEVESGSSSIDFFDKNIVIKGETAPYTLVKINEVPISLKNGYMFESNPYPITSNQNVFTVTATNQLGVTSKIVLVVNKKENTAKTSDGIAGTVTSLADNINLTIKTDSNITFNGKAYLNDAFPILAKSKLEVITDKPESVKVYVNNQEYVLDKKDEIFEFSGGQVTLK